MKRKFLASALCLSCLAALLLPVCAADGGQISAAATDAEGQTHFDSAYCFSAADFGAQSLRGIVLTELPDASVGVLRYGRRILRAGDILDASVLEQLRFEPCCTQECDATLRFCAVYGACADAASCFTLHIGSGKNKPPKAEASTLETYKNIANDGVLSGSDPENGVLTFRIVEQPKRGTVELKSDGSFVYTPAKNKVGEDSFTFTVTDDAGQTSEPAAVTIRILKPSQRRSFADMRASTDEYEAMWLRECGLYGGKSVAGTLCFAPDESVTRAEFLVMLSRLLELPTDEALCLHGFEDADHVASWMRSDLASAQRCGLLRGEKGSLRPNDAVTAAEAAAFVQNARSVGLLAAGGDAQRVSALEDFNAESDEPMTRIEVAQLLRSVVE